MRLKNLLYSRKILLVVGNLRFYFKLFSKLESYKIRIHFTVLDHLNIKIIIHTIFCDNIKLFSLYLVLFKKYSLYNVK